MFEIGWLWAGETHVQHTYDLVDFGAVLRAPPEEVDASDSTAGGGNGIKHSGGFATVALAVSAASASVFTDRVNTSQSGLVKSLVGWD